MCVSLVCLPEQEAGCWVRICSDGLQSATSSGTTTASGSSPNESQTESCPQRPSSLTCVSSHSPVQLRSTEDLRTWLRQAFPANPSPSQASVPGPKTSAICGPLPSTPSAQYDPATASWRTCQDFFHLVTLGESWATWPKAGMTVAGAFYPQPKWERRIAETDFGLWLTPSTEDHKSDGPNAIRHYLANAEDGTPIRTSYQRLRNQVAFREMWPTPAAQDAGWNVGGQVEIVDKDGNPPTHPNQRWYDKNTGRLVQKGLTQVAQMWPTPTVNMVTGGGNGNSPSVIAGNHGINLVGAVGGTLNPRWVEWLMDMPDGWLSLKPLEMHKWQAWLEQHGIC